MQKKTTASKGKGEKVGQEPTSGMETSPAVHLGSCKFMYSSA